MNEEKTIVGGVEIEGPQTYGIDMGTLIGEYRASMTHTERNTHDYQLLDKLVDGVPVQTQNGAPYVGDTTLAGLVRQIPRESLQQIPLFAAVLNGTKHSIKAQIASYILRRGVFNEDTFGRGLLNTMTLGAQQALTHGFAPFMCATGTMYDEFGTTMKLLHYSDVGVEPGISDAHETGYEYVKAELVKSRVRKIRDNAADNPDTTWNVPALDRLLEMQPESSPYSIYQSETRKDADPDAATYTFVTRYETGRNGQFVTFCPQIEDEPLRVIKNKSKFGYPRVQFLVLDPAPLTPFGMSRVRLASPNQNLMNAYYQNVASMFILNSKPPLLKRGRFTKPVQLKQGVVWETLDQNATVELKEISNSTLQQFPQIAERMAMQIQNMMGKPIKNTDLGNTSPGAKQQIKYEDTSTNQVTNILENFLRQYAIVALDTYISEQVGEDIDEETGEIIPNVDTIILDDDAKNAINRIGREQFVPQPDVENDPMGELGLMTEYTPIVGDDNKIEVNWNELYDSIETWSVEIELSIGKDEMEEKARGDLQDTLVTMTQNADPNDPAKKQKIDAVEDRLLEKMIPDMKHTSAPQPTTPPVTTDLGDQVSMTES